jgi:hypothetical protein
VLRIAAKICPPMSEKGHLPTNPFRDFSFFMPTVPE